MAATVADPIVAKLVSPEALADLLENGRPDRPLRFDGLKGDKLGSLWKLYLNSEYRVGKFYISVPSNRPTAERFRLRFHMSNWIWKLYNIDLPVEIQIRLAQEILKTHPE